MKRIRAGISRLLGMFPSERRERELADEIEAHLQMHIDDNLRSGMTLDQARRNAVIKLGGVESTKQVYRERRTVPLIENIIQDGRFSIRQLRKNPGFTCTAILMLALGMCASVAIFAFVDAALINPLPYKDSTRLVGIYESIVPMCPQCNLSYLDYLDWKKQNTVFSSMDVYQRNGYMLNTPEGAQSARGERVSDGFFRTLGVVPVLGRDFYTGEDAPGSPRTVILSYAAWQKRYGGAADILGQTVTLDGEPNTIIGILPKDFHFAPAGPAEFWTALRPSGSCDLRRSCHNLYGIGRLNDGASVESALANTISIAQQLEIQYPDSNKGQGASVQPLSEVIVGQIRPVLLLLLGGAGLLLLIATVNVSSLLLVRSESRRREIAVRAAIGASPARLVRLFVTEGVVLVIAGLTLGMAAAYWLMQLLTKLIPLDMMGNMPYLQNLGINTRVVAFGGLIAAIATVLFSITPTLHLSLSKMRIGLAEGSRGSAGTGWRRLGSKLVVLELAIAMILLVGAGLLGKSFYRLLSVELGVERDHLATIEVIAPRAKYGNDEQAAALGREVVSHIENLPGVKSVGISSQLPISGNGNTTWIRVVGHPFNGEHNETNFREVSSGYFATLGAKLLRGRNLTEADSAGKQGVVVINQELARQFFPGEDPVGKQIGNTDLSPKSIQEIVGVVENIKEGSLESEIWPAIYIPFNQSPEVYFSVVVRTLLSDESFIPTLTTSIREIDRDLIRSDGATMNDRIINSPSAYMHRSTAWLVGGFAALALVLSVLGLYGVIAYSVSQRTREIGVRMALGADPGSVYRLILGEAGRLVGAGAVLGVGGSIAAATLIRGLFYGVRAWDVPALAMVASVLIVAALLASYIPARHAASINPIEALRSE